MALRLEYGFVAILYGQSWHVVDAQLRTSLALPAQQSRHFARITFRSGGAGWVRADSVAERLLGRLIFVLAGPVTIRVPRCVGKAKSLAPAVQRPWRDVVSRRLNLVGGLVSTERSAFRRKR
jgi:hypothetical protein